MLDDVVNGNKCGHKPGVLRHFHPPVHHKSRPNLIEQAKSSLCHAYDSYKKSKLKFNFSDETNRLKRSERREAIVSISQLLLHYMDMATFNIVVPIGGDRFRYVDLRYIANKLSISFIRCKRAISDLVKCGYLLVKRQMPKSGLQLPSIRQFTAQFFIDLGIDLQKIQAMKEYKNKVFPESSTNQKAAYKPNSIMTRVAVALSKPKSIAAPVDIVPRSYEINISDAQSGRPFFLKDVLKRVMVDPAPSNADNAKDMVIKAMEMHRLDPSKSLSEYMRQLKLLESIK